MPLPANQVQPARARARYAVSPAIRLCSAAFSWMYSEFGMAFL